MSLDVLSDAARLATLRATQLLDSAPEEAVDRITRLAARVLRAPTAVISLVDDRRQFFKSQVGLAEPWASRRETPLSHSFCQHAVASGDDLVVEDSRSHPLVHDNLAVSELGVVAYAGVPLVTSNHQALGALCVIDSRPRSWTQDEVEILRALAESFSREVDLRLLTRELARQSATIRSVLDTMTDGVVVAGPEGEVMVYNHAMEELFQKGASGTPDTWSSEYGLFLSDGKTPCPAHLVPMNQALAGNTVEQFELFIRLPHIPDGRWHSVNGAPIRSADGTLLGGVTVGRDVTARKQTEFELARLTEELRAMSLTDELTGLNNRRGFLTLGERELRRAARNKENVLLLFIDLDGMKEINDRHGHEAGDRALCDTAELLRACFRDSDVLARLGGDEFVVLAHTPNVDQSTRLIKRLRAAVVHHNQILERPFQLSLSIGETFYDAANPRPLDALLKDADCAMYERKRRYKSDRSHARPRGTNQ
jgi:diguanylate cyclase (GGDEF)-like protein